MSVNTKHQRMLHTCFLRTPTPLFYAESLLRIDIFRSRLFLFFYVSDNDGITPSFSGWCAFAGRINIIHIIIRNVRESLHLLCDSAVFGLIFCMISNPVFDFFPPQGRIIRKNVSHCFFLIGCICSAQLNRWLASETHQWFSGLSSLGMSSWRSSVTRQTRHQREHQSSTR